MATKHHKPEEIMAKLHQVDVLTGRRVDREGGEEDRGDGDYVLSLEVGTLRRRRALSDLTLDMLILSEAVRAETFKPFPSPGLHRQGMGC